MRDEHMRYLASLMVQMAILRKLSQSAITMILKAHDELLAGKILRVGALGAAETAAVAAGNPIVGPAAMAEFLMDRAQGKRKNEEPEWFRGSRVAADVLA
jgi:hypothetical protein